MGSGTELGGFEIPTLVIGITQLVKQLFSKLSDNGVIAVAIVFGLLLYGTAQVLPLLNEQAAFAVLAVVRSIGYTLAIPGLFGVAKRELPTMVSRALGRS